MEILTEPAKSGAEAYLSRANALLSLRRIPEIEEALAKPPATVDLVELEIRR